MSEMVATGSDALAAPWWKRLWSQTVGSVPKPMIFHPADDCAIALWRFAAAFNAADAASCGVAPPRPLRRSTTVRLRGDGARREQPGGPARRELLERH